MCESLHPVYASIINPELCLELLKMELHVETAFKWIMTKEGYELDTDHFDKDNYYNIVKRSFKEMMPPRIPAFQADDMERLLPNYYMERENNLYTLLCEKWFTDISFSNPRLPDLFGNVVLEALKRKIITPAEAVIKILSF